MVVLWLPAGCLLGLLVFAGHLLGLLVTCISSAGLCRLFCQTPLIAGPLVGEGRQVAMATGPSQAHLKVSASLFLRSGSAGRLQVSAGLCRSLLAWTICRFI